MLQITFIHHPSHRVTVLFYLRQIALIPKENKRAMNLLLLPSAIVTLRFLCRAILKLPLTDAETRAETETTLAPLMKWHSIYFENSISTKQFLN